MFDLLNFERYLQAERAAAELKNVELDEVMNPKLEELDKIAKKATWEQLFGNETDLTKNFKKKLSAMKKAQRREREDRRGYTCRFCGYTCYSLNIYSTHMLRYVKLGAQMSGTSAYNRFRRLVERYGL
ncbi:hypothetical protein KR222_005410 [Zaprionus bogoriensis]|nr:hypothetical protein KR222_005410 [Zaprionus bogoriensis]